MSTYLRARSTLDAVNEYRAVKLTSTQHSVIPVRSVFITGDVLQYYQIIIYPPLKSRQRVSYFISAMSPAVSRGPTENSLVVNSCNLKFVNVQRLCNY